MARTTSAAMVLLRGLNKLILPAEKQLPSNLGLQISTATYVSFCYIQALDFDTIGQDLPKIKWINEYIHTYIHKSHEREVNTEF